MNETVTKTNIADWIPLAGLFALSVVFARPFIPAWGFVFALSFSIFFGFKWLTLKRAVSSGVRPGLCRALGYVFLWVGMDAARFLDESRLPRVPRAGEWAAALLKTALGCAIFWLLAREVHESHALTGGYVGFTGFLILTFFGVFHLLSLAWRSLGADAVPIMRSPLLASSPSDFWSRRWNLAFKNIDSEFVFRPAARRWGLAPAVIAAFLFSGALHDLVTSFPVNAWYGAPTLYFTIQAAGVILEKSRAGIRAGLASGPRGRAFTIALVLSPVLLLFHPPAIEHAFIPFMRAAGAL
ncbi:MAG TPA: MBOAT family protein [Thermodesulfobacteriota bacterium]|nr:MBOAT family protein [Thermodesulfobacteriota bacterium]